MWKKGVLLVGLSFIGLYALFQVAYYATSVPSFCGSCHEVTQYVTSWQTSAHKNFNCMECHQPSGELGKFHAKARGLNYVFQHFSGDYTIPTSAPIFEQNCIQCHLGDNKAYPTIRLKNTSKVNHYKTIRKSQSCLECHRETGHSTDIYLSKDLKGAKP
ncbi:NapC/NirT family cytochrome c [Desulfosporosinus sp.]|uniref:cytochrome c3 family protein n=1 Tax=Desulfosporosinus sp. TaxID=157907 RepID=UPI0025BBF39E|nr:NapC/NirT family cytochrome c [Desulfosporosinus sp.]MBC2722879.1 NapC/NirT family cytochrome c [Desulfosporosinus sp.]MBC2727221.1 NapC/NirT family cytochrome c [Desulfosporosinus sp.]